MNVKRKSPLVLLASFLLWSLSSFSQNSYTMWDMSSTDNEGILYDTGGKDGDYAPDNTNAFTIEPSNGQTVKIRFFDFDIEPGEAYNVLGVCNYDFVTIHDGPDTLSPILGQYCGSDLPPDLESTGNALTVWLFSDPNSTGRGFDIRWSTDSLPERPEPPVTTGYCQPSGYPCDTVNGIYDGDDYIEKVKLASLLNSSLCSSDGYSDFTHLTAVVEPGSVNQLDVNLGGPGSIPSSVYAWADWNNDTVFSADEEIVMVGDIGAEYFGGVPYSGTVNPPAGVEGFVRLRIKVNGSGLACAKDNGGEVEDYHIYVGDTIIDNGLGYCPASGADCFNRQILAVQAGGVNNTSGCSNTGYSDFTDQVIVVAEGAQEPIVVTSNGFGNPFHLMQAWVDWNHDLIFSSDELIPLAGNGVAAADFEGTIIPPQDAIPGFTRLRIRYSSGIGNNDPCGPEGTGEVEDYSLLLGDRMSCISNVSPAINDSALCTSLEALSWDLVPNATQYSVSVSYVLNNDTIQVINNELVSDTFYTFNSNLVEGAKYLWSAIAKSATNSAYGCTVNHFYTAGEKTPVLTTREQNISVCTGSDAKLEAEVLFGKPDFVFEWTGDVDNLDRTDTNVVVFNSATVGSYQLSLSVNDANNCNSEQNLSFVVDVVNSASAGDIELVNDFVCIENSVQINWVNFEGSEELEISSDGVSFSPVPNDVVNGSSYTFDTIPGSYFIRGVVLNNSICKDSTEVLAFEKVEALDKPLIKFKDFLDRICFGDSTTVELTNSGDYSNAIVNWLDQGNLTDNPYTIKKSIPYHVTVLDTITGCKAYSDTIELNVVLPPAKPEFSFVGDPADLCVGDELVVSIETNDDFVWFDGDNSNTSRSFTTDETIYVDVTNSFSCKSTSDTLSIVFNVVPPKPEIVANGLSNPLCEGDVVSLSNNDSFEKQWSTGEQSNTINVQTSGNYFVTVFDKNCENSSDILELVFNAKPQQPSIIKLEYMPVDSLKASVNGVSYSWMFNGDNLSETEQVIPLLFEGNYSVAVTSAEGCISSTSALFSNVGIKELAELNIKVKTLNDTWLIESELTIQKLELFTSNGSKVGEAENTRSFEVKRDGKYLLRLMLNDEWVFIKLH